MCQKLRRMDGVKMTMIITKFEPDLHIVGQQQEEILITFKMNSIEMQKGKDLLTFNSNGDNVIKVKKVGYDYVTQDPYVTLEFNHGSTVEKFPLHQLMKEKHFIYALLLAIREHVQKIEYSNDIGGLIAMLEEENRVRVTDARLEEEFKSEVRDF